MSLQILLHDQESLKAIIGLLHIDSKEPKSKESHLICPHHA